MGTRLGIRAGGFLITAAVVFGQTPTATFQRICGTCHSIETVTTQRRTRAQWQESIAAMIQIGAKGTDDEFAQILEYLAGQYGPGSPPAPAGRGNPQGGGRGRGAAFSPGPADKQVIDEAAALRGRKVYAAECITCHGTHARGGDKGADLIRSEVILHDRYGSAIGPFLKAGHPTQSTPAAQLTDAQIQDLSHTLHQEVYNTLRAALEIQDVLTGDAKTGEAYFRGVGKCASCHSATGDLAHIAARFDPAGLQQRFLFPGGRGGRGRPAPNPISVTVTPPSGAAVTGMLVHLDDFNVSLRDKTGEYRSFKRSPGLKVVKNDPLQAHHELLDQYTDQNVHDIVAYLETLK